MIRLAALLILSMQITAAPFLAHAAVIDVVSPSPVRLIVGETPCGPVGSSWVGQTLIFHGPAPASPGEPVWLIDGQEIEGTTAVFRSQRTGDVVISYSVLVDGVPMTWAYSCTGSFQVYDDVLAQNAAYCATGHDECKGVSL